MTLRTEQPTFDTPRASTGAYRLQMRGDNGCLLLTPGLPYAEARAELMTRCCSSDDDRNDLEIGLPFVSVRMTLTDHAVSNECAAPSSARHPIIPLALDGAHPERVGSGASPVTLVRPL